MLQSPPQVSKFKDIDNLIRGEEWHPSCVVLGNQEVTMWIDFLKQHYRIVQFTLLAAWILLFPEIANCDDNFNFYFQKAPGPVVVNQGTRGAEPTPIKQPLPPEAAAETINQNGDSGTQLVASANKAEEEKFRNWAVGLNAGYIRDPLRYSGQSMLGLDLEYSANKMLSFGVGMLFAHKIREKYNRNGGSSQNPEWYTRIAVTPLNLRMFEHNMLDIGFAAGIMSAHQADYRHRAEFYIGPTLDFNFSSMVALRSELHYSFNKNYQALGGLRVRF